MIVDTSALIAIFQAEPEAADFAEALAAAHPRQLINRFLERSRISVASFDEAQAIIVRDAFMRFGKGRHRAALNFGDCMTYALAKREGLPVLCKGTDFAATDLEVVHMPSATYKLFVEAMARRQQVLCIYHGYRRELCPFILGRNKTGEEAVLAFQFAGETSEGRLEKPEWKCLLLAKVAHVRLRNGPRHGGESHSQQQKCVVDVDYDVNPNSPYNPSRRLPNQTA
jgi:uncharacterized protein with PIN domain